MAFSQMKSITPLLGTLALGAFLYVGSVSNAAAPAPEAPSAAHHAASTSTKKTKLTRSAFKSLIYAGDQQQVKRTLDEISAQWDDAYIPALLEVAVYTVSLQASNDTFALLAKKTGQNFGRDANDWYHWWWNTGNTQTADYAEFKADLYAIIDAKFETYFRDRQETARIRLDEIRWGGVVQDGIPPLRDPDMIAADEATYLDDSNIVFGIEINGDARAYPKRVLAWHEMFVDTVGGVDIAGVYCTLCGTVIPYKTEVNGINHQLGTSGFLYRSNKLMYDKATQSLWNTIKGEPVLGPLVDQGIQLEHLSVVTTSWGEWKRRHPDTQVLSLETGHRRDYGEGVAYNEYFATDQLMFNTPFRDTSLKNKQEILALRFAGAPNQQLAIDTDFLARHPVYKDRVGPQRLVVLTDKSGANRVYDPGLVNIVSFDGDGIAIDADGRKWTLSEAALTAADGTQLARLPYHRAFWFGWKATFPETRLVK